MDTYQYEHPFFMWSISEAWHWLTHLPVLGFVFLIVLGLVVFVVGVLISDRH